MRLLTKLCSEHRLAAIVNIHDVALAQMFLPRIVGLRDGEIVYDGPADGLSPEVLTRIYGEEDWTLNAAKDDEDDFEGQDRHLPSDLAIAAQYP
jgi:phosphonate transport system ATP-binding protein